MTEDMQKRKRSESPFSDDNNAASDETRSKIPRVAEISSKLTLTLNMEMIPSQESDFMAWFQPKIEEEVSNRGGSLISVEARRDSG